MARDSHSLFIGYLLWIFGFTGSHRFYYGKPISGTLWFFTFGLFGIGWFVDLFLIPGMDQKADTKYPLGLFDYTLAWVLLTFFGFFGLHRLYIRKWVSGIVWALTFGLFGIGYLYDLWTLNEQVGAANILEKTQTN
jgi:TM2 domain-containing membrane protein YozV